MNTYETHMAMHTCHEGCRNPICLGVREAVAAEREACAKVCDELGDEFADANPADCAEAIRARSK